MGDKQKQIVSKPKFARKLKDAPLKIDINWKEFDNKVIILSPKKPSECERQFAKDFVNSFGKQKIFIDDQFPPNMSALVNLPK